MLQTGQGNGINTHHKILYSCGYHTTAVGERQEEMTLDEMKTCGKMTLTAAEIAPVLGSDQHAIRLAARQAPEGLGFPVICIGSRVKIPTLPFIEFMTKLKEGEA